MKNMKIFDENSQVAKRKKNEFIGLKRRNVPAKKNKNFKGNGPGGDKTKTINVFFCNLV